MSVASRYQAIASRCSEADLRAVWAAVLFGRRSSLRADLQPIADELESLRLEVGLASAARTRPSECTVPKTVVYESTVQHEAMPGYRLRRSAVRKAAVLLLAKMCYANARRAVPQSSLRRAAHCGLPAGHRVDGSSSTGRDLGRRVRYGRCGSAVGRPAAFFGNTSAPPEPNVAPPSAAPTRTVILPM